MKSILVVLPNWFGETLFVTPFLRALHLQQPGALLTTLGRPACREILLHHPAVHELLDLDGSGPGAGWRALQAVRRRRFDSAYILRRSLSRTALLAMAGVRERIGFENSKSGWLLTRRVAPAREPVHKALSYLPLLGGDIPAPSAASFDYTVSEEERAQARRLLEPAVPAGARLVILHPGANWSHKRWPAERFGALGEALAAAQHARVAVTGSPDDAALAASVQKAMRQPAMVLAGRTSLRELAACLEQAALVVSNDTGILHLAAALRRPLVGLYGPTSPALTGPLGDPARITVLHHADACPQIPCLRPEQGSEHPGMASITVDEAYDAACKLLDRHG